MKFKRFWCAILIGLLLLPNLTRTAHACEPPPDWDIFLTGDHFVIGEVVEVNGIESSTEIIIQIADYFAYKIENEAEIIPETIDFHAYPWQADRFEVGDYVAASFEGTDFCNASGRAIFHVTSLDYEHLQVKLEREFIAKMLTDFINQRGRYTYIYHHNRENIYRQNRENPLGFTIFHDPTSLILGNITALEEYEITIEIWDEIYSGNKTVALESLTLQWTFSRDAHLFDNFNIGDDIAVRLQRPNISEATVHLMFHMDLFSINNDNGTITLKDVRGDESVSAFYTDLLRHRNLDLYLIRFGVRTFDENLDSYRHQRYGLITRLEGDQNIVIYEQEIVENTERERPTPVYGTLLDTPLADLYLFAAGITLISATVIIIISMRKKRRNQ